LKLCEVLGQAFLAQFRALGFKVAYPDRRLIVVTLKSPASYAVFLGQEPDKDEGGCYDLVTKRLVVFDFTSTSSPGDFEAPATRKNLFSLVHELAHQLSFNTGLLDASKDVPLCISEGLATCVELWRKGVKYAIGAKNVYRLEALRLAADWIPVADLLTDDKTFHDPQTAQLAYGESWVLVHYLLKRRLPATRAYLAGLQPPDKAQKRIKVAEKNLGPLAKLDREIKSEARRLLRE
jgi:hypothetical protein